jgi:hypothetical protein
MKLVIADLNNRGIYRTMDEIYGDDGQNDTGLCNRLLCWELLKIINHIHDNQYEVVIDKLQNPETNNCFDLEDTTLTEVTKFNFNDYEPLTDNMVQDIIDGNLKLEDKNYYTDFSKRTIHDFKINYPTRFVQNLKFRHQDINEVIQREVKGCIGIHIRRGRGVKIHNDKSSIQMNVNLELDAGLLTSLPRYIFDDNIKNAKISAANSIDLDLFSGWNHHILSDYIALKIKDMPAWKFYQFDFIKDEVYFEKIDLILQKNPKQKFYISHDLKDSDFKRWKNRYRNNLLFKSDFYDVLNGWEIPIELHTQNFLDLYCLSNTREIFKVPSSTWSELACDYNKKIGMDVNLTSNEEILEKVYQKNLI